MTIPAGTTESIDFKYMKPKAWVYGDIRDETGSLIDLPIHVGLENRTTDGESSAMVINGHYTIPAVIEINGSDSTNYFQMRVDDNMLIPDYLVPDDNESFPLSYGDSLEKNLTAFTTDTLIYGYVTEDGGPPSQSYQFYANSDSFGRTGTMSDQSL